MPLLLFETFPSVGKVFGGPSQTLGICAAGLKSLLVLFEGGSALLHLEGSMNQPAFEFKYPVILYDGSCKLCHGAVRFIVERDPDCVFMLCPLRTETADQLISKHCDPSSIPDSLVLVTDDSIWMTGDAALQIAQNLNAPWPFFGRLGGILPKSGRDGLYRFVARNRYRWFGKTEPETLCEPEIRARMI